MAAQDQDAQKKEDRDQNTGLEPGSKLGAYEIITRLSGGGMASLYLGRRTGAAGFAKPVAVKVVHPHLARNPQFIRMFVDEAKLSARIEHPNVVHVEELSHSSDMYYLVMEYVHGSSLAQILSVLAKKKKKLIPELAVWIAGRVAEGLHAAHETKDERGKALGVVHRDVSPQNVLVSTSGHIKLIDFGIAKALGRTYQTATGSLKGKLRYMAPEQARSSEVDRRTDIYALGIILWEMLTMRRLFRAENDIELLEKVRYPKIEAPSTFCTDVPSELDDVVMQALSREQADRPETGLQFFRMLLDAMPEAAKMDATRLSEVLQENLGEELLQKTRLLPQSVTQSLHIPEGALALEKAAAPTRIDGESSSGSKKEPQGQLEDELSQNKSRESESKHQTSVIPLLRVTKPANKQGSQGVDSADDSGLASIPPGHGHMPSPHVPIDDLTDASRVIGGRNELPTQDFGAELLSEPSGRGQIGQGSTRVEWREQLNKKDDGLPNPWEASSTGGTGGKAWAKQQALDANPVDPLSATMPAAAADLSKPQIRLHADAATTSRQRVRSRKPEKNTEPLATEDTRPRGATQRPTKAGRHTKSVAKNGDKSTRSHNASKTHGKETTTDTVVGQKLSAHGSKRKATGLLAFLSAAILTLAAAAWLLGYFDTRKQSDTDDAFDARTQSNSMEDPGSASSERDSDASPFHLVDRIRKGIKEQSGRATGPSTDASKDNSPPPEKAGADQTATTNPDKPSPKPAKPSATTAKTKQPRPDKSKTEKTPPRKRPKIRPPEDEVGASEKPSSSPWPPIRKDEPTGSKKDSDSVVDGVPIFDDEF